MAENDFCDENKHKNIKICPQNGHHYENHVTLPSHIFLPCFQVEELATLTIVLPISYHKIWMQKYLFYRKEKSDLLRLIKIMQTNFSIFITYIRHLLTDKKNYI